MSNTIEEIKDSSTEVKPKSKRIIFKLLISIISITIILIIAFLIYTSSYYHAGNKAYFYLNGAASTLTHIENTDSYIVIAPPEPKVGFIFYPGAKVEASSYVPLMVELANADIQCIILKMPFNLAFFDINGADGIQELYPDINKWFIGGHSLGGAMSSLYLEKHPGEYEGLILLASFTTVDLSSAGINALSIYGSEDNVLNIESYNKYKSNLPRNYSESIIEGGCHAYFGDYGKQKGDGEPTISMDSQLKQTSKIIEQFVY